MKSVHIHHKYYRWILGIMSRNIGYVNNTAVSTWRKLINVDFILFNEKSTSCIKSFVKSFFYNGFVLQRDIIQILLDTLTKSAKEAMYLRIEERNIVFDRIKTLIIFFTGYIKSKRRKIVNQYSIFYEIKYLREHHPDVYQCFIDNIPHYRKDDDIFVTSEVYKNDEEITITIRKREFYDIKLPDTPKPAHKKVKQRRL